MKSTDNPNYIMWDERAFIHDAPVRRMNSTERWAYRTLLQAAFWCSTRPYLPDDDSELWLLAGCENQKQWEKIKSAVRKMFAPEVKRGLKVLGQKRLVSEWKRLLSKRRKMAENGREGGLAKAKQLVSKPLAVRVKQEVREVKQEEEVDMSAFKDKIGQLAWKNLKVTIQPSDKGWSELLARARIVGGQDKLVDAFDQFCQDHAGEPIAYPLSMFLKFLDGYVEHSESVQKVDSLSVHRLINHLVTQSDGEVLFDKKQQIALSRLLESYSEEEIRQAFREFWGQVSGDDFQVKHAARKFCETAEQILALQVRRKEEARNTEELIRRTTEQEQKRVAEELAEIARKEAEESALVEEHLPIE